LNRYKAPKSLEDGSLNKISIVNGRTLYSKEEDGASGKDFIAGLNYNFFDPRGDYNGLIYEGEIDVTNLKLYYDFSGFEVLIMDRYGFPLSTKENVHYSIAYDTELNIYSYRVQVNFVNEMNEDLFHQNDYPL
jgi:hypothetical protein